MKQTLKNTLMRLPSPLLVCILRCIAYSPVLRTLRVATSALSELPHLARGSTVSSSLQNPLSSSDNQVALSKSTGFVQKVPLFYIYLRDSRLES
jgi:hypothetical protein